MTEAHCGHCGYDLVGLGLSGRCPECGRNFNKATRLNTRSHGGGVDGDRRGPRRLAAALAGLGFLSAGAGGAVATFASDPLPAIAWGLLGAGLAFVAALWALTR